MLILDKAFISYSQLGEDKLVRNILDRLADSGVSLPSTTYLDVGSYHPVKASNTYALYKNGWSGTAVDANDQKCRLFKKKRPRDLVVSAAVVPQALQSHSLFLAGQGVDDASERVVSLKPCSTARTPLKAKTLDEIFSIHHDKFGLSPTLVNVDIEGLDADVLVDSRYLSGTAIPLLLVEHFMKAGAKDKSIFSYECSELNIFLERNGYRLISVVGPTMFFSHETFWVPFARSLSDVE